MFSVWMKGFHVERAVLLLYLTCFCFCWNIMTGSTLRSVRTQRRWVSARSTPCSTPPSWSVWLWSWPWCWWCSTSTDATRSVHSTVCRMLTDSSWPTLQVHDVFFVCLVFCRWFKAGCSSPTFSSSSFSPSFIWGEFCFLVLLLLGCK